MTVLRSTVILLCFCSLLPASSRSQDQKPGLGVLPSVTFKGRSVVISDEIRQLLVVVAEKVRKNPEAKLEVIGYGESCKTCQQLSWDRVNSVVNYLVEKEGISSDRLIFRYGQAGGEVNTVDLRDGAGEEGPSYVPPPHPDTRHAWIPQRQSLGSATALRPGL